MAPHSSSNPSTQPVRLAVVGGGVAGLAAAHRLQKLMPRAELVLFEASDRLGGPLHTLRTAEETLEQGADSFLVKTPFALDLCRELGLAARLVPTSEQHRRALVVRRGKLLPVPEGFVLMRPQNRGAMLQSAVLSPAGKLRMLAEPFIRAPRRVYSLDYDESVASFATRRLGREVYERLVQPLIAGVFVADAHRLSLAATFPEFLGAERECGSLWASVKRAREEAKSDPQQAGQPVAAARYGQFVSLEGGLKTLVDALAESLPPATVRLNAAILTIAPAEKGGWTVTCENESGGEVFDGVVVATPAPAAGRLLQTTDAALAGRLTEIEYASSAVVTFVYRRADVAHPLDGFGAVVPAIENRPILAASFLNVKFPRWAPKHEVVIRTFMGGVLRPEMVDRDDQDLIATAQRELQQLIGASGPPVYPPLVVRWRRSMPQYHVGHLQRVADIESRVASHAGLQLAGSGYRGVGIPQCVRSGQLAAERLADALAASRRA